MCAFSSSIPTMPGEILFSSIASLRSLSQTQHITNF